MDGSEPLSVATVGEVDAVCRAENVNHGVVSLGDGFVKGSVAVRILLLYDEKQLLSNSYFQLS